MMIIPITIIAAILLLVSIIMLARSVYLVRQAEAIVIERLGQYHRVLSPGLHMIMPFMDRPRQVMWSFVKTDDKRYYRYVKVIDRIDLRESVYDFPKQNVITKDNVTMEINALLYYQITDVKSAVYEIFNLPEAIEKLTQTTLRNVIGSMDLDESLVSRDAINERLRLILDDATDKWGVKINRVELQEVNPPADIRQAMEKQMRAERDRRAVMLEAEGTKGAAILQAEGIRESQVLKAKGEAEAEVLRAQAEAQARLKIAEADAKARIMIQEAEAKSIVMIQQAVPGTDPLPYLIAQRYINALPEMLQGKNDKVVLVPYEASSLMGSVTAIKKLFDESSKK